MCIRIDVDTVFFLFSHYCIALFTHGPHPFPFISHIFSHSTYKKFNSPHRIGLCKHIEAFFFLFRFFSRKKRRERENKICFQVQTIIRMTERPNTLNALYCNASLPNIKMNRYEMSCFFKPTLSVCVLHSVITSDTTAHKEFSFHHELFNIYLGARVRRERAGECVCALCTLLALAQSFSVSLCFLHCTHTDTQTHTISHKLCGKCFNLICFVLFCLYFGWGFSLDTTLTNRYT